MASYLWRFLLVASMVLIIDGSHFRGGIISWRAVNTTPSGATAQFLLYQRYSWKKSFSAATACSTLGGLMSVTGLNLGCYFGTCTGAGWPTAIGTDVYCTDYDATIDFSSGERYDTVTLSLGTSRSIGFYSSAWFGLAYGLGNGYWSVMNMFNAYLRPDGVINTSPVTTTLPVIYKTVNVLHVHVIPMSDADSTDILKCRWATGGPSSGTPATSVANINNTVQHVDECGSAGVCPLSIPNAQLIGSNCTLSFTLAAAQVNQYFAIAIQIEDFYNTSSTTPMSSVPVQFLFYAVAAPGACSVRPVIIGARPNRACIGTPIGVTLTETVVAQAGCVTAPVVRFTTASPKGLTQSSIVYASGTYTITLSWVPTALQYGPQGFCAAAVDNLNQQSDQWCITFLVGFTAPNLQTPVLVQGSASPIGTVFANQSIFTIQSQNNIPVNRPSHNGTYISFYDLTAGSILAVQYDCGWSPNVIYSGSTIIINAPYAWIPGHRYYVTFDSGATSGNDFCHAESAPVTNPAFWQFDIWNPALSSTTTTTTTPPTTGTVTSRGLSTTTPVANLTTTGIVITTVNIVTSTVTTTTTSTTTTTTTATLASTTSTLPDTSVMSASDFEKACKEPTIIATTVSMVAMFPIHAIGMFTIFTKLNKMFNPNHIRVSRLRHRFNKR